MIAPTRFSFNEEAFETNKFQKRPGDSEDIRAQVMDEFYAFVEDLRELNIEVIAHEHSIELDLPDAVFPNNWISTHRSGELLLYPMAVPNRRAERSMEVIQSLMERNNYRVKDLSNYEQMELFLEGTGSIIFDHENKIAYVAESPRSNRKVLDQVCQELGYKAVSFTSYGGAGELIYHTNVMMCVGRDYVIIGADTIAEEDRDRVLQHTQNSGKQLILLTNDQVYNSFAGNMLQIENVYGESVLVMSRSAHNSLRDDQLMKLNSLNDHVLAADIPTIERIGGGSARCMLAEVFPVSN